MKIANTLIFVIALIFNANAQSPEWSYLIGGPNNDSVSDPVFDEAGNMYICGGFSGTIDLDLTEGVAEYTAEGTSSFFIAKYDQNQDLLWAKVSEGEVNATAFQIQEYVGELFISGSFDGTVDFDLGEEVFELTTNIMSNNEGFLLRLDNAGEFVWAGQIGGFLDTGIGEIYLAPDQQALYVAGYTGDASDLDPGPGVFIQEEYETTEIGFFSKVDFFTGELVWTQVYAGDFVECRGWRLDRFGNGDMLCAGIFDGSITVGEGDMETTITPTGDGFSDIFFARYDVDGNLGWVKTAGGSLNNNIAGMDINSQGEIVWSTFIQNGTIDVDPSEEDVFLSGGFFRESAVIKWNDLGEYVWSQKFTSSLPISIYSVEANMDDKILLGGQLRGTIDVDLGDEEFLLEAETNGGDVFWVLYDDDLNLEEASVMVAEGFDSGSANWVDNGIDFTVSGSIVGMYDFDPFDETEDQANNGGVDGFIQRYALCPGSTETIFAEACSHYQYNDSLLSETGVYDFVFENYFGCDSIIQLDLTIFDADTTLIDTVACNEYLLNDISFTESGMYELVDSNEIGCDGVILLDLVINYSTLDSTFIDACDYVFFEGDSITESGEYFNVFMNEFGCESITTAIIDIHPSSFFTGEAIACDEYILGDSVITESGLYTFDFVTEFGCDSIVEVDLTLFNSSSSSLDITACESYEWEGQVFDMSGTYELFSTNTQGCDSIITLNLTINDFVPEVEVSTDGLTSTLEGETYQWLDCDDNLSPIEGETGQTFEPTTSGNYAVELMIDGCIQVSECVNFTVSSVFEHENNEIEVYPNPVSEILTVRREGKTITSIMLFDVSGRIVLDETSIQNVEFMNVNVSNFKRGKHVGKVQFNDGSWEEFEFIKE